MCGVAGIFSYRDEAPLVSGDELVKIRDAMISRGPDGRGDWIEKKGRVGLAHRRLSIIDLSERAAQPMWNATGTLAVVFNGEIYNYKKLQKDLESRGCIFCSDSDTEVLLHLYQEKGEAMLFDLRGMFAFALWDDKKQALFLARDPYGIKPLYYSDDGQTMRFASQVKALIAGGGISSQLSPAGVAGFFLWGHVPEPFTIHSHIRALPAGHFMWVRKEKREPPKPYFSLSQIFADATFVSPKKPEVVLNEMRDILRDSIRHHYVSDVPVGIFLSSGIDSTAMLGLAHDEGFDLETLTLKFEEYSGLQDDEAPLAGEVARYYGARHTERLLGKKKLLEDLPKVFEAMDQPTVDGVNMYFVSKVAKELGWKVALTGLGGDELFGGYSSFHEVPRLTKAMKIPSRMGFLYPVWRALSNEKLCQKMKLHPKWQGLFEFGGNDAGNYFLKRGLFMPWELSQLAEKDFIWEGLKQIQLTDSIQCLLDPDPGCDFGRVAVLEASLYMRNQLLRDADWAGMTHSVEIRTPWVDSVLVKQAAGFLRKVAGRNKKGLLAHAPRKLLPKKIRQRPKTGFLIPIHRWIQEESFLKEWRQIPQLCRANCPWARRWAFVVFEHWKQYGF